MRSIFHPLAVNYLLMSDPSLSERDACTKLITPAVERAGWDIQSQVREEASLTAGRAMVRGQLVARGGIVRPRARRYWSREGMTHVQRLVMLAGLLLYSACSILNQPVNPDGQSSQTGGVMAKGRGGGSGGGGASGGAGGSSDTSVTQECLAELALLPGSCGPRALAVPCLASTGAGGGDCLLDDCQAWETACAQCFFGICCPEYAAWHQIYPTCSQDPGCDLWGGPTWMAWRTCGLSNCTAACNY
jgi:hypothetical protein